LREYECLMILPAEADEAVVGTATDRISKVVAKHAGQVSNVDRWGRRRLAYEIDRKNEGYYALVTFSAEPAAQLELERTLNLADEVLRHKVTVLPRKREKLEPERPREQQLATSPASADSGDATSHGE
jgi:small subunit ribosomal protein S6